jgi:parvulin-like peptidyl-prolyl isomerase
MKLICTILAGALASGAFSARGGLVDAIQARVDDSLITHVEVETATEQTADVLGREFGSQPEVFNRKLNEQRAKNLETLLNRQLILHEFKTAGYSLPETVVDEMVQERIHSKFGTRQTLTKTLEAEGLTYEKFRQQIRDQFIIEALRQKNISAEILISPHKIETYYTAHREDFKVEDQLRLSLIVLNKSSDTNVLSARKLAEDILAKLNEGVPFGDMAVIHSQGSQRKERGDTGWLERSAVRKELADVALTLKPGQHSGVIETEDFCYLLQLDDVRPAHFKPLSEMREQIERNLQIEERVRIEKQWMDKLRKKTFVRYY